MAKDKYHDLVRTALEKKVGTLHTTLTKSYWENGAVTLIWVQKRQ
jgi:hypothetical protein